jgi:hypothetical protein
MPRQDLPTGSNHLTLDDIATLYPKLYSEKRLDEWQALFDPRAIAVKMEAGAITHCQNIHDAMPEQREYAADNRLLLEEWDHVDVQRHGRDIAIIKANYSLTTEHEIRRGIDVLTLVRGADGWRIINLAYEQSEFVQR